MQMHNLHKRVQFEQTNQVIALLESVAVTLFAVVTAAILPQLILQFMLRNGQMPESQPFILEYLPHIAYGIAALTFVMAVLMNLARVRRIRQYREEIAILELTGEGCECGGDCHHDSEDEAVVDMESLEEEMSQPMEEIIVEPVKTPRRKRAVAKKTGLTRTSRK